MTVTETTLQTLFGLARRKTHGAKALIVRFALQRPLLDIVNGYFGMFTKLRYYTTRTKA